MKRWPGGFIQTLVTKTDDQHRAGKGIVWLNNDNEIVEGQPTTDFAHLWHGRYSEQALSQDKKANTWGFPNLDLQIHMHRYPQEEMARSGNRSAIWFGWYWFNQCGFT